MCEEVWRGDPLTICLFYCGQAGASKSSPRVDAAETSQEKFTHYFHIYFVCIFIEGGGGGEEWERQLGENA